LDLKIKNYYGEMTQNKANKYKNHEIWIYIQNLKKKRIDNYQQLDRLREKILVIEKYALKNETFITEKQRTLYNIDNFDKVRSLKS
jgi:carboxypeptidase C (cathepsin A)